MTERCWPLGRGHGNNFDLMRLLLAIAVIYSHSYALAQGKAAEVNDLLNRLTGEQLSVGGLAVYAFFAISGLLVANSLEHSRGVGDFLWKRAVRIYPGFLVAFALSVGVAGLLGAEDRMAYLKSLAHPVVVLYGLMLWEPSSSLAFASAPFPNQINGSMWTIKYEAYCYVALATLSVLAWRGYRVVIVALFVGSVVLLGLHQTQVVRLGDGDWRYGLLFLGRPSDWIKFAPFFLGGTVFYLLKARIPKSRLIAAGAVVLLVFGTWLGVLVIIAPICLTYLLFHLAFSDSVQAHGWSRRIGDLSYGTYLYAFPVQQLLVRYLPAASEPLVLFALATVASLGLAALSWHLIEAPALRLKALPVQRWSVLAHRVSNQTP